MKDASRHVSKGRSFPLKKGSVPFEALEKTIKISLITISRPVVVVVGIPTRPPECLLGSGRSHAADRRGGRSESPEAATASSLPCFQAELPGELSLRLLSALPSQADRRSSFQ
ncbi:conserved hypothetical protein [Ricinus communis]|uniref:Uncharacterized protein n=1 Tax=Ricinus communis TaxID=3988 RepID=B9STB8_RICCO|nr:conserved hypothetical protein [Ricinus communis]